MSAGDHVRRGLIFVAVLGGGLGLIALLGDDPRTTTDTRPDGLSRPGLPDDPVVPVADGTGMGSGRGVRISKNALAAVGLPEPVTYRVFEAEWARQTPLPGGTLESRRLRTEDFRAVFFPRPTIEEPRPPAIEGPGSTRVDADEADIETDAGASLRTELRRNVVVVRHDVTGDLTLRADRLALDFVEGGGGAKDLHATTDTRVVLEGKGARIEGVGMAADLGRRSATRSQGDDDTPTQLVFQKDVIARFDAPVLARGPADGTTPVPSTITCAGAAEMTQIAEGDARRPARWRTTFRDDVVIRQYPTEMRAQFLDIEFEVAPPGADGASEFVPVRVVADGDVVFEGRSPDRGAWSLRAAKAVTARDAKGAYQTDLTGGTLLAFDGTLRGQGQGADSRMEIRCAGPATLTTNAAPLPGQERVRGRLHFADDVVATQWNTAGEITTKIDAPEILLTGEWLTAAESDGRLDVDTLTATGTDTQRVQIERHEDLDLVAKSHTLTWRVLREVNIEKLLFGGTPSIQMVDRSGTTLVGTGTRAAPGTIYLDARDHIDLQMWHDPALATQPDQPFATAAAAGDVILRGVVGEKETYRLEAQTVDLAFDADRELRSLRAYLGVVVEGAGGSDGDAHIRLQGDRLAAVRDPEAGDDERIRTDVQVFGDARNPAEARIEETRGGADAEQRGSPLEHVIRGEQILYGERGTRVEARRSAHVTIDASPGVADAGVGIATGPMQIEAQQLVIHLDPAAARLTRGGDLRRVEATGGVTVRAPGYEVTGQTVEYDNILRNAVARGQPARAVQKPGLGAEAASGGRVVPGGFLNSEEILVRLEPDPTDPSGRKLRVARVTCQGGFAQYHLGASNESDPPTRVTIQATGPIEILPASGSAQGNVEMRTFDMQASGSPKLTSEVLAERVDLVFDARATGTARDRLQRAIAVGTPTRPVRMYSPTHDATADRAELIGSWIELTSPWGTPVHVMEKNAGGIEFVCDKGRFNPRTAEFKSTRQRMTTRER